MAKGYYFSFGHKRWDPTPLWVLISVIVIVAVAFLFMRAEDSKGKDAQKQVVAEAVASLRAEAAAVGVSVDLPEALNSESYLLLQRSDYNKKFEGKDQWADATSGAKQTQDAFQHNRVRMEKAPNKKIYPASMIKVLTALVLVERLKDSDYDETLTLSDANFVYLYEDGASIAGFERGEVVKIKDLVYGVLVPSGSECTAALADYVAGGQDAFVALMNEKAQSIGMTDSHFTNPVGLHDEDNYTTVSDIALLLDYAMRDERFAEVFTTQDYTTSGTNKHPDGLNLRSTLYQKQGVTLSGADGSILGGKTGYTSDAGQCLASYMVKNGERFILVTAAAMPEDFHEQALHVDDMLNVFDHLKVTRSGD
jgi:D-alanyl-D-alanine carboxypeptidase (penicillin-binding protein 5/6)